MRLFLVPFSLVYYLISFLRNFLYERGIFKARKLNAKVISVGNITWGGTGKTPSVAFMADALLKEGKRPAILARGYGNDEKDLLLKSAREIPVIIGKDRFKTGQEAIGRHRADSILLDDGFQHRRIKRDLDIVCIDATNPFGNRLVIPAGSMREGLGGLKRADVFLLTKVDLLKDQSAVERLEKKLKRINPDALIVRSIYKPGYFYKLSNEQLVDFEILKDKEIALVSAIGNPRSFEKTVSKLGLKFKKHFIFRDHHWYKDKDLNKIKDYCNRNNIDTVLTTEKDAVKLRAPNFLALHIELEIIENEQAFYDRLFGIYNS